MGRREGGSEPGEEGVPQEPTEFYFWVVERIRVNICCLERNCSFNQRGMREGQRSLFFSFQSTWVKSGWIVEKNHTVRIGGPLGRWARLKNVIFLKTGA